MYEPVLNSVLVQIDDKDAEWGGGNDESMLGASFQKGKIIQVGQFLQTEQYPITDERLKQVAGEVANLKGRDILWNEGTEAGTIFEFDGKKFGFIYWWDIRGVLVGEKANGKN